MILDLGCGDGRRWIRSEEVVGIDINEARLKDAKARIFVARCDGRFLPFRDSVFSVVITDSVLEHIQDYRRALFEVSRVLAPGGTYRMMQPVDNDPIFFVSRRVARNWRGDKIRSYFTARQLLRSLPASFTVKSVGYLPNAPFAGLFGFFNMKNPPALERADQIYGLFCKKTTGFRWKALIDLTRNGDRRANVNYRNS